MNNFKILNYLLSYCWIFFFQFACFLIKPLHAKTLLEESPSTNNLKVKLQGSNKVKVIEGFSEPAKSFEEVLRYDLKKHPKNILNLIALKNKETIKNYSVEIESNSQFEKNNTFYAEGDAVLYFGKASLKADLITYDTINKILEASGNVVFKQGNQYFQAANLVYNFKEEIGFIDQVYGIIDAKTFSEDLVLDLNQIKNVSDEEENIPVEDIKYINSATIGLVNDFETDKKFNITDLKFDIPDVTKWRFKTDKLNIASEIIKSEEIFFTNDAYNKPQFVLKGNNFSAEIVEEKVKLISRNSWIILDDKLKFPIGRRTIFDRDPLTKWGVGADFVEKDGYYIFRGQDSKTIFGDYELKLQPTFLLQRAIKGNTKSFTSKGSSIFSEKVKDKNNFLDLFALDIDFNGKFFNWELDSDISFNSLNFDRFDQALRSKLALRKRINLNKDYFNKEQTKNDNFNYRNSEDLDTTVLSFKDNKQLQVFSEDFNSNFITDTTNNYKYDNFLDLQIYNIYRENISKRFSTEEIYFANGISISNNKSWSDNNSYKRLSLIYDIGNFKSKSRSEDKFEDLFRNAFVGQYEYNFKIWEKSKLDKNIDSSYKYSPKVINQGIEWESSLQTGLFLYSDDSSQSAVKLNTGPKFTLGSFKNNFFDFTVFRANISYGMKSGESPFAFDNIDNSPALYLSLKQQIFGPLILSVDTSLNLDEGTYSDPDYALDFKRRAYSLGVYYDASSESLGLRFNIFNFDYSGISSNF